MLVHELIKKLQRYNPNREVRFRGYDFIYGWEVDGPIAEPIETVKLVNVFDWSGKDATGKKEEERSQEKIIGVVLIGDSNGL